MAGHTTRGAHRWAILRAEVFPDTSAGRAHAALVALDWREQANGDGAQVRQFKRHVCAGCATVPVLVVVERAER